MYPSIPLIFSYLLILSITHAQTAINPLTIPACATVNSIIQSCFAALGPAIQTTSSAFSCICYSAINYVPEAYDDQASSCISILANEYGTTTVGNAFVGYVDTFCVDPSYAPKTVVATTTENSSLGPSTSSPTSNSIGPESTASSPSSTSATIVSPSTTGSSATGQSQSSGGGGVATIAGSSTSSTASSSTSKGEAGRMINVAGDGSLLSILGSLFAAVFIF